MREETRKYLLYIKENLSFLLDVHRYSIERISRETGIDQKAFRSFVNGEDLSVMDMDEFIRISYALNTPLYWLLLSPAELRDKAEQKYGKPPRVSSPD